MVKVKGEFVVCHGSIEAITDRHDTEGYLFGNDIYNRGDIPDLKLFTTLGIPIISRLPMDSLIRIKVLSSKTNTQSVLKTILCQHFM